MKKYLLRFDSYDFFGKTRYQYEKVEAKNCLHAVFLFRDMKEEYKDAELEGVKPMFAFRWRKDPSLLDAAQVEKAALALGWRENGHSTDA